MWWIERLSEGAEAAGRTIWLSRGILSLGRSIVWVVARGRPGRAGGCLFLSRRWLDEASTFFWIWRADHKWVPEAGGKEGPSQVLVAYSSFESPRPCPLRLQIAIAHIRLRLMNIVLC